MVICLARDLVARSSFTDGAENTAKSFKNWDTCMNDRPCKIIAIVGIVVAGIAVIWLIGGLLTCFRQGVDGICGFLCWCCNCKPRNQSAPMYPVNDGYLNARGPMAGNPSTVIYQPIQPPESAYYRPANDSYYNERSKSAEVFEMEQDFDLEKQRQKSLKRKHRLPAVVHDDAPSVYEPRSGLTNHWGNFNNNSTSPYPNDGFAYKGYEYQKY